MTDQSKPTTDIPYVEDLKIADEITAVVREADHRFEKIGGTARHYVRDLLLPLLHEKGLLVTRADLVPAAPTDKAACIRCERDDRIARDLIGIPTPPEKSE